MKRPSKAADLPVRNKAPTRIAAHLRVTPAFQERTSMASTDNDLAVAAAILTQKIDVQLLANDQAYDRAVEIWHELFMRMKSRLNQGKPMKLR